MTQTSPLKLSKDKKQQPHKNNEVRDERTGIWGSVSGGLLIQRMYVLVSWEFAAASPNSWFDAADRFNHGRKTNSPQPLNNGWSPARVCTKLIRLKIWQESDLVDRWWPTGVDTRGRARESERENEGQRESQQGRLHFTGSSDSKIIYSLLPVA